MSESHAGRDGSILSHFGDMDDPRMTRTRLHELVDILTIVLCGSLCGVDDFVHMEMWAEANMGGSRRFSACRMEFHRTTRWVGFFPCSALKTFNGGS